MDWLKFFSIINFHSPTYVFPREVSWDHHFTYYSNFQVLVVLKILRKQMMMMTIPPSPCASPLSLDKLVALMVVKWSVVPVRI